LLGDAVGVELLAHVRLRFLQACCWLFGVAPRESG
jgi:hypothetical protein